MKVTKLSKLLSDPDRRLALLARRSEVSCSAFGNLTVDAPFVNRVIDTAHETALSKRFTVTGTGTAKLIAFYTPA